ncbi:hypothetical protein ACIQ2D_01090 [Lysinibacillus sp. NPDC097287]|uniref:hypothetical protein n=1 Tax=Lysinibacillus sp. NPDC097287 TaxID=3364144 RepID=UPI0038063D65
MTNMITLIKFRMRHQFQLSKLFDKDSAVKSHAFITFLGYGILFLFAVGYVVSVPLQMNLSNQLDFANPYILSLLFWALSIWSLFSGVKSLLFGYDHDQVFVLPLDKWQAILINFISKYIIQVILCFFVLFVYEAVLFFISPFPLENLIIVFLFMLITPLMAIILSSCLALIIRGVLYFLRIENTMFEAIVIMFIYILPLAISYLGSKSVDLKSGIIDTSFLRYSLLNKIEGSEWLSLLMLIGLSIVLASAFLYILVINYDNIITVFNKNKTIAKKINIKTTTKMQALVKKEFGKYFSSFSYVSNTILGPLALLIVGFGLLFGFLPEFNILEISALNLPIASQTLYFLIFLVCTTLTTTTSCSFSFEGKTVWVVQSLPISIKDLCISKGIINISLLTPGLIIAIIDCWFVLNQRGLEFLSHIILLVCSMVLITLAGLILNLKHLSFNWSSEMVVVKQSMSTILTAVVSMILISITALLILFFGTLGVWFATLIELLGILVCLWGIRKIHYLQER